MASVDVDHIDSLGRQIDIGSFQESLTDLCSCRRRDDIGSVGLVKVGAFLTQILGGCHAHQAHTAVACRGDHSAIGRDLKRFAAHLERAVLSHDRMTFRRRQVASGRNCELARSSQSFTRRCLHNEVGIPGQRQICCETRLGQCPLAKAGDDFIDVNAGIERSNV